MKKIIALIIMAITFVMFVALVGCGGGGSSSSISIDGVESFASSSGSNKVHFKIDDNNFVEAYTPIYIYRDDLTNGHYFEISSLTLRDRIYVVSENDDRYKITVNPIADPLVQSASITIDVNIFDGSGSRFNLDGTEISLEELLAEDTAFNEANTSDDPIDDNDNGSVGSGKLITFTVVGQDPLLIGLPAYVFKSDASFRTFKFDSDSTMFVIDDGDKFKIQFGTGGLADGTHIEISPSGITGN